MVDAVRCAIEVQNGLIERNAGVQPERRIEFRVGIHLGDVVEEADGDLMGDGVNIAARLQSIAAPGAICLSEQAYWQVKGRLDKQRAFGTRAVVAADVDDQRVVASRARWNGIAYSAVRPRRFGQAPASG